MSQEEVLKRKSVEVEPEDADEAPGEPQLKMLKGDEEMSKHNLETSPLHENADNEIHDSPPIESCTETAPRVEEQSEIPPSITIKFHNKAISDLYKEKFLEFLNSLIDLQVRYENELSIDVYQDDTINLDEWVVIDDADKVDENTSIVLETTTDLVVETDTSVVIETNETPVPSKKRKKRSKAKKELFVVDATPSPHVTQADLRYTTKFTISTEKSMEEAVDKPSKQTCFNCNQFHALKDCPKPKDYTRINTARQRFRQQPKSSRYHLEGDQKYSHLEPGKLSDQLRNALGLYKNEAPHYIYLMRKFGYPPGWLEEAKLVHSNLDMFDIDGKNVKATEKKHGLDPGRIVDFPGFNVPFEKGVKDDHRKYGVPPFSDNFSKDAMINFYNQKFPKGEDNLETCDMDIDHEHEGKPENKTVEIDQSGNRDSPSLIDLEQKKLQLLEQLNDDDGKVDNKNSISERDLLSVKESCFGTPILKSNSPYMKLPDADNFSKDVSPVINFENLPNSTGKYEQMTDVLQKVRSTLKKIHSG